MELLIHIILIVRGLISIPIYPLRMKKKHYSLVKIGSQIRGLREAEGYSQEDFAAEVGMDRSYMGGVERGERNLAVLNLIRIAKALEVEVGELFPPIDQL